MFFRLNTIKNQQIKTTNNILFPIFVSSNAHTETYQRNYYKRL